ncbi:MAG: acyl-CoA thioesterase [Gammaproteobacteria bacterium]|nr:acyl-CoA thioesterase [Gammaproteobacteria bacterium]MCP5316924.1 acyl-CoA thioesterase [Chromatiaceae bacterium]MCW5586106.1 acyl-CoA thioesterase [Chromatiales bacterium]MCB1817389.1 acyl-CoA thioesterase [Gammaproteobacteria bacterium]MCP5428813.1 acyl-CoA thioesterase [Chromatiaceae bacterium]
MPDTDHASQRELTYRVVAMPADTNAYGDIFGGWLMSQVDIAGSILAIREAEGRVATVAVKEFRFLAPVSVGDLVSCYAEIRRRGQTSITVHVVAEACRQLEANLVNVVADATLVYVALGDDGRPRHLREMP